MNMAKSLRGDFKIDVALHGQDEERKVESDPTVWGVSCIYANDLTRFVDLRSRLARIDLASVPRHGIDKFEKTQLTYTLDHVAPPERLFAIGRNWRILNCQVAVSFGGTVSPTADGFQLAELLAQDAVLNSNAVIVSGGVIGIDMAAHLGALDVNGKTVAVLANPVTMGIHPYIPKRTFLEAGILREGGLLVSEYDVSSDDRRERLLQRDRVITALSDIFVAVECSKKSATFDTAMRAKIQGKKVVAVDWSKITKTWHKPKADGSKMLIDNGIAEAIPRGEVADIRDPNMLQDFRELLMRGTEQPATAN